MGRFSVQAFKCDRCGHVWLPKKVTEKLDQLEGAQPKVCPKCKSPYWNTPRKAKVVE